MIGNGWTTSALYVPIFKIRNFSLFSTTALIAFSWFCLRNAGYTDVRAKILKPIAEKQINLSTRSTMWLKWIHHEWHHHDPKQNIKNMAVWTWNSFFFFMNSTSTTREKGVPRTGNSRIQRLDWWAYFGGCFILSLVLTVLLSHWI